MKRFSVFIIMSMVVVLTSCKSNPSEENLNNNLSEEELLQAVEATMQAYEQSQSDQSTDNQNSIQIPLIKTSTPRESVPTIIVPTSTPSPTRTVHITITPPEEVLLDYFGAVVDGDYQSAWDHLTDSFKDRVHENQFSDYVSGYEAMNICDIDVSDVNVRSNNGQKAEITAHYVYEVGENCQESEYDFFATFFLDAYEDRWLLEGLTYVE